MKRIIGRYDGQAHGPLIIALAALHGNEPAGVFALQTLFQMLEDEPSRNPDFQFRGRLLGLRGNIQAAERRLRYVRKDLNRQFTPANIKAARLVPPYRLAFEDLELVELLQTIRQEIVDYKPQCLVILDLHTTSASGGIFTLVSEETESLALAASLNAPVVRGLVKGIGGTTLHYFNTENMGIPTVAVSFEAGQHDDALSIQRSIAWLVNVLRAVKSVSPYDVESRHDAILRNYARHLPKVVEVFHVHPIQANDHFEMAAGFKNFQAVKKDELLAHDKNGPIYAPKDCLILMPLYQKQGTDGFFLVEKKTL